MANPQHRQQDVKHIIEECAGNYEKNLLNRYVLFGPTDGSHPYETFSRPNVSFICADWNIRINDRRSQQRNSLNWLSNTA